MTGPFVDLLGAEGTPLSVNVAHIVAVEAGEQGTSVVWLSFKQIPASIALSRDAVLDRIDHALRTHMSLAKHGGE